MTGLLLTILTDFLYPRRCAACGQRLSPNEKGICPVCAADIYPCAGKTIDRDTISAEQIFITHPYCLFQFFEGHSRKVVHALKFHGFYELGLMLGRVAARSFNWTRNEFDAIIPVPSDRRRESERGFNQAELIGRGIASLSGIPMLTDCCVRKKHEKIQSSLRHDERYDAVIGAFRCVKPEAIAGKRLLLVDDVYTTGSTISELARTMIPAGAGAVTAFVICTTHPH